MIDQYPPSNGVLTSLIWRKTAAGGETSLSGYDNANQALSYTPGQEQVYLNGILLVRGDDYTATNGTSITGLAALSASDFVQVNCYNNFSVASVPTTSLTGTVTNAQLANSAITINGSSVSLGGSVTLAGDIESVTASSPLTGGGTSGTVTIGIQSASTSQSGAVQLTDSTSSTSTTTAATPASVKSSYDLANAAIPKNLTTTTGDIIYASGANTPARLGIGSTGQVLTVSGGIPSWAAPASSGGMTLLSTTTVSGSPSTISATSINQSYKELFILITGIGLNAAYGNINVTFNSNTSNYRSVVMSTATNTITSTSNNVPLSFNQTNHDTGGDYESAAIRLVNYTSTNSYKPYWFSSSYLHGGPNTASSMGGGTFISNTAVTSVQVNCTNGSYFGGNMVMYIYGVN